MNLKIKEVKLSLKGNFIIIIINFYGIYTTIYIPKNMSSTASTQQLCNSFGHMREALHTYQLLMINCIHYLIYLTFFQLCKLERGQIGKLTISVLVCLMNYMPLQIK
jgi:hypothetical protein